MFALVMSMNILTIVRPSIHSLLSNNLNILIIGARGPEVPEVAASDLSVPADKDVRKKEVFWCSGAAWSQSWDFWTSACTGSTVMNFLYYFLVGCK